MADGTTLAGLRSLAGLTQKDVADRMGVTVPAVHQIEHRDYVRDDTAARYQRGVVDAIREDAISGLLADSMQAIVNHAAQRGMFILETGT
jgi:transcriptional regulator with XRE-family HTH domain